MSKIIDKRKRSREEDVLCDSTPLSKRINNLHLTNFEETQSQLDKESLEQNPNKTLLHDNTVQTTNKLHTHHQNPGGSGGVTCMGLEEQFYNPELSESQNPFYYDKNKLLHDLHLERIKRCTV